MTASAIGTRRNIRMIVTHRDPDIDDIEAIRLLRLHGNEKYPGIVNAPVITTSDRRPWNKSPEELENKGVILVGIGGSKFDEHPFGNRLRKENECATTLVAEHLGIYEDRALRRNIAYALEKNYSAVTTPFDVSLMMKLAFRYLCHTGDVAKDKEMVEKVFSASFMLLNAAEDNEHLLVQGRALTGTASKSTDEFIADWLIDTFDLEGSISMTSCMIEATLKKRSLSVVVARRLDKFEDKTLRWILEYADRHQVADTGRTETDFDLASLVELAQKHFCVGEGACQVRRRLGKVVGLFLTAMWQKDVNFQNCEKDYNSPNTRRVASFRKPKVGEVKIVSVVSNNAEIAKFCRSNQGGKNAVIIKREPCRANTQVFFDQKYGVDPKPIIAALRIAERATKGMRGGLTEAELQAEGNSVPGAAEWYFDGHQIMNGSLTTEQPPTKLSREKIEGIVGNEVRKQLK